MEQKVAHITSLLKRFEEFKKEAKDYHAEYGNLTHLFEKDREVELLAHQIHTIHRTANNLRLDHQQVNAEVHPRKTKAQSVISKDEIDNIEKSIPYHKKRHLELYTKGGQLRVDILEAVRVLQNIAEEAWNLGSEGQSSHIQSIEESIRRIRDNLHSID